METVAFIDNHASRLVLGDAHTLFDDRDVFDATRRLNTAGGRHHNLWCAVVDAAGKLPGGKAAEDADMYGAEASGRQHRDQSLRDHRHVDHDPISFAHTLVAQSACEHGYTLKELLVRDRLLFAEYRGVINDRGLIPAAVLHVTVHGVVAHVQFGAGKPLIERRVRVIERLIRWADPVDAAGRLKPEALRIIDAAFIYLAVVFSRHDASPQLACLLIADQLSQTPRRSTSQAVA